jgi:hypothetical protein
VNYTPIEKKVFVFATEIREDEKYQLLIQATFTYMNATSKTIRKKAERLDEVLSPYEQSDVPPFVFGKYFLKGKAEGKAEGALETEGRMRSMLQKFILKNLTMSDQEIADYFEVPLDLVQRARKELSYS